jgi:hypothetical protein
LELVDDRGFRHMLIWVYVDPTIWRVQIDRSSIKPYQFFWDWLKGKSTGNHGFYHQLGVSCKFPLALNQSNEKNWDMWDLLSIIHQAAHGGRSRNPRADDTN